MIEKSIVGNNNFTAVLIKIGIGKMLDEFLEWKILNFIKFRVPEDQFFDRQSLSIWILIGQSDG